EQKKIFENTGHSVSYGKIKIWVENAPVGLTALFRNGPKIDRAPVDPLDLVRFPIAHIEGMRDNPRAWFQLAKEIRLQLQVDVRQQIHGHDRCGRKVDS